MFKAGLMTEYANVNSVPYVVIDGIYNSGAITKFAKELCKAYKGP